MCPKLFGMLALDTAIPAEEPSVTPVTIKSKPPKNAGKNPISPELALFLQFIASALAKRTAPVEAGFEDAERRADTVTKFAEKLLEASLKTPELGVLVDTNATSVGAADPTVMLALTVFAAILANLAFVIPLFLTSS